MRLLWPRACDPAKLVASATILNPVRGPASTQIGAILARLDLLRFVPFRLNRLAAEVSNALSAEYQQPYGLHIPEWPLLAPLAFPKHASHAHHIPHLTPPPKPPTP